MPKKEYDLNTLAKDSSRLRQIVDNLQKKIDSGLITYEEFKIVKFFTYLVVFLLFAFETISLILIFSQ